MHHCRSGHGGDDEGDHVTYESDICWDVRLSVQLGCIHLGIMQYSLYFTFKKNYHKSRSFNLNLKIYS